MNFTPVSGAELQSFDEETRQLYSKRVSDERLTTRLLQLHRNTDRNYLPVIANPVTQWQQDRESYQRTLGLKTLAFFGFGIFAMRQFSKAYFHLGIILRNSIPQTPAQKVAQRAPIGLFFGYLWYKQREFPRQARIDLTDDSEQ